MYISDLSLSQEHFASIMVISSSKRIDCFAPVVT